MLPDELPSSSATANMRCRGSAGSLAARSWASTVLAAAAHAALLVGGARAEGAPPAEVSAEAIEQMRSYLAAAPERVQVRDQTVFDGYGPTDGQRVDGRLGNGRNGGGERHEGTSGEAGSTVSRERGRRFAASSTDPTEVDPALAEGLEPSRSPERTGLLASREAAAPVGGRGEGAWVHDPLASIGALSGRVMGSSGGAGGLGATGAGAGGGGNGKGVGLGTKGGIGHTAGAAGSGTGGAGSPSRKGDHRPLRRGSAGPASPPRAGLGRLPPEVIQRIVRQNFGRFRACLEKESFAWLPFGRVVVRFTIDRSGGVSSAAVVESTVPSITLPRCVAHEVRSLRFPEPDGVVVVSYPILFGLE